MALPPIPMCILCDCLVLGSAWLFELPAHRFFCAAPLRGLRGVCQSIRLILPAPLCIHETYTWLPCVAFLVPVRATAGIVAEMAAI